MDKFLNLKFKETVAFLTFNRPAQLNSMNRAFMDEIIAALDKINANTDLKVAIIRGSDRSFMAGADIKEYAAFTDLQFKDFQDTGSLIYEKIENSSIPFLASVHGFALGGGFEIMLACDMVIASKASVFGLPEVFLGLVPGGGGTQRLIRHIGLNRTKEMLFLGGKFPAETLYQWGIVNILAEDENDLRIKTEELADKLSRRSKKALMELKKLAHLSLDPLPMETKLLRERQTLASLYKSAEAKKNIQNFIKKIPQ